MALVKCRECAKEVSAQAKTCPNCGIKNPAPQPVLRPGRVIILLIVGFAAYAAFKPGTEAPRPIAKAAPTPAQVRQEADFQRALLLVQTVKKSLHDPSSLDITDASASDTAVAIKYRAKNAFGALVLNYAVLANDGKTAAGSKQDVAALWNKHIGNRSVTDLTSAVQGAKLLGVY